MGILQQVQQQAAQPAQPPQQQAQPAQQPAAPSGGDRQAIYDTTMNMVRHIIYDDQRVNAVLQTIQEAGNDMPGAIGHLAASIVTSAEQTAQEKGKQIPTGIAFRALFETVAELIDLASSAGLVPEDQMQQLGQPALEQALATWGDAAQKAGRIDEGSLQGMTQMVQGGQQQGMQQ